MTLFGLYALPFVYGILCFSSLSHLRFFFSSHLFIGCFFKLHEQTWMANMLCSFHSPGGIVDEMSTEL